METRQDVAAPLVIDDEQRLPHIFQTPARRLSLRANFVWTFAGNVIYAGCQWLMLVVLAKLGKPEMVGQYALALAVTAPVLMFASLDMRTVIATDAKGEYRFTEYLGMRLLTTVLALLAIAGITFVSGYSMETVLVILIIGLSKGFDALSDIFYGLFQQHELMNRIAISKMLRGIFSLAILGIGVYLTRSLVWGVVGIALAWGMNLVLYDARNAALILSRALQDRSPARTNASLLALRPRLHLPTFIRLAWLALPLGIVLLLISLNTNIPRYFIESLLGERNLGFFAAMSSLMVAGNTVVGALGQSASPRLAQYYAAGNLSGYRTLVLRLVGIGTALGLAGIAVTVVAGRELLTLLYRPEYAEFAGVLPWLMVAAGIGYVASFLGESMTSARYFWIQMPLFVVCGLLTLVLCAIFIPTHALYGAALALCVAITFQLVGSAGIVLYAIRRKKAEGAT